MVEKKTVNKWKHGIEAYKEHLKATHSVSGTLACDDNALALQVWGMHSAMHSACPAQRALCMCACGCSAAAHEAGSETEGGVQALKEQADMVER